MIHPDRSLGQGATAVSGMRVIDEKGLQKIRKNLKAFAKQIANPAIKSNSIEIAKRLAQFELNADAFVNAFSSPVKS